jgi:purine-binding chemotaxis protein CheW
MATSALTDAVPVADGVTAARPGHFLTFTLGAELFALDIRSVREIIQVCAMTPVPLMPGFVRGVINLRGAVVPVIDPHARFGRPRAELGKKSCIVVFEGLQRAGEKVDLGLLVDAVSAVVEIADAAIEEAPNFGATVRRDYIRGVGKLGPRFVVILEPAKAFDIDDMAHLCEAAQLELA